MGGLDEVALTLTRDEAISAYETRLATERPWVVRGTTLAA
jgi:3-isopropylmalate/(R)-2-methylmalate dehydratase small subunit